MGDSQQSPNTWRTSSASGGGNCVEVSFRDESILVRRSHDLDSPILSFTRSEWKAFIMGAVDGEFDIQ